MADISYFQNEELEDSSDGMEDEYGKSDDQAGDNGGVANRAAGPQLTPLNRMFLHAISDKPAERQMVGKLLINIFQNAVKSKLTLNLDEVFQSVEYIIYDTDSAVRSSLVECLPHVAILCQDAAYPAGDNLIKRVLTITLIYLRDEDNQVRQDAQTALRLLLEREMLDDQQIEKDVCSVIVELSRDKSQEFQTLALTLMTRVNPYIDEGLMEKLFLDRFLELCTSEAFFVRRVCASIIGEFCTMMSKKTIYNKLLQTYTDLCSDSVWGVRKTSVDVMMSVARCVSLSIRRMLLADLLVSHLYDESRWVRRSAYEILGPFISTFAKQFHDIFRNTKGELVLVHGNECGWERFNTVPVAKMSDILSENLASEAASEDFWMSVQCVNSPWKLKREGRDTNDDNVFANDDLAIELKKEIQARDEKFNLFQYYYDPPTMPLDHALVQSIINDNEKQSNKTAADDREDNENCRQWSIATSEDSENKNVSGQKNDTEEASNENVEEINEQQESQNTKNMNLRDYEAGPRTLDQKILSKEKSKEGINNKNEDNDDEEDEEVNEKWERMNFNQNLPKRRMRCKKGAFTINEFYDCSINMSRFPLKRPLAKPAISVETIVLSIDEEQDDEGDIVPPILVDRFVSMANSEANNINVGPDLDYHCAFSFPAVVLTLGKDNWHRLKDAYQRLASAVAWKVRSTLASSIHEIAIIIEKDYAARDLVPIYNGFIKDLDEVRIGALKHFSTFLRVLSPQDRMQYLPKLNDFLITDSKWNWRLREELVKQLSEIIYLYQRTDVAQYIAPLVLHLVMDRVAAVRQKAIVAVAKTVEFLENNSEDTLAIAMIQEMRDVLLCKFDRWMVRQTYVLVCSKLVKDSIISGKVFAKELLPYLMELSYDKVPNVRLVVARTLARDVVTIPEFLEPKVMDEVKRKLKMMQSDCDRDVRIFASEVETDNILSKLYSVT